MWKRRTAHTGWREAGEKAAQWNLAKYIIFFFCSQMCCLCAISALSLQSLRTNTTASKPLLMLCTWLLLCCCYIHKFLVILGLLIAHAGRWNFLLAAAAACRAELLHLEWHFGGWALQVNRMSRVQPNLCYFGVAGLLLSSCISDLALGFCSFANSLHWLSLPFQYTNTHHGNASYYKSRHGKLIALALHVPDNVHLLMLFAGLWVLAILTLRLWDWINDDKSSQIPVPPCLEECWQRVQIHWAWQLLVKPWLANSHQGWGTNGQ